MGVSDIGFHLQASPIGALLVAATERGVCAVDWGDRQAALDRLERRLGAPARPTRSLRSVRDQLDAYFAGELRRFDVPLDLHGVSAFCRAVLTRLAAVPFGTLTSYGSLARALRTGPRAVGRAVGSNPVPVLVPCHRVIAADGTLGGFGGGLGRKRILLALEGHDDLAGGWEAGRRAG